MAWTSTSTSTTTLNLPISTNYWPKNILTSSMGNDSSTPGTFIHAYNVSNNPGQIKVRKTAGNYAYIMVITFD